MSTHGDCERDPVVATIESAEPSAGVSEADAAGPAGRSADEVPIGTLIGGKYRVERVLGEGPLGIVLPARCVQMAELVDPDVEEPLPSTRPDGRAARMRESNRV